MYYCNNCGIVKYLTRPENPDPPSGQPMITMFCQLCQVEAIYRKVLPEDFNAAHEDGVNYNLRALYKKLTMSPDVEDLNLDFLSEEENAK